MNEADLPRRFAFVDLFAGVGGFHAAMKAYGGECVYAVESDRQAANVYKANWGHDPFGDITDDADDDLGIMNVPPHDVLCAGFPCQPFSKSGAQRGMDETRGTLFFNIASIVKAHRPAVVILENVRNLIGPRHDHEYSVIIETLRELGYHVSDVPAVFSPHLLPPEMGGAPQVRERVFITATYAPATVVDDLDNEPPPPVASMSDRFDDFDPKRDWEIESILDDSHNIPGCELTDSELLWLEAWEEFVQIMRPAMAGRHLPGFPIWADSWLDFPELRRIDWSKASVRTPKSVTRPVVDQTLPDWKKSHLRKNHDLFARHFEELIPWAARWGVFTDRFPASRRKLEWQAQETKELKGCLIHLRPSGIRAKKPNYLPALVAITQTSIVGPRERRLSPRETARLQGLPDTFVFPDQPPSATYKQMGNGVNVGAVWHIFREHVRRDADLLRHAAYEDPARRAAARLIAEAIEIAPSRPNELLAQHRPALP